MALRPWASAASISSRYGSQALAEGLRPGDGTGAASESVDTPWPALPPPPPGSVDTWVAGFAGGPVWPGRAPPPPPPSGTRSPSRGERPCSLQSAGATSPAAPGRSPARASRRSRRWPSRRRAWRFSAAVNVPAPALRVAGFQVSITGRFGCRPRRVSAGTGRERRFRAMMLLDRGTPADRATARSLLGEAEELLRALRHAGSSRADRTAPGCSTT